MKDCCAYIHNHSKLPKVVNLDMVKCVKITMSNDEEYTLKVDDLVAIQFIKDDKRILVRRGRVKDLVVISSRELSCKEDNVSRIILDCSEQFTVKILEIKFSEVIKIGNIDDEFEDYSDRITELKPDHMKECEHGTHIPVREHGMCTKGENCNCDPEFKGPDKIITPPASAVTSKGFAIMK